MPGTIWTMVPFPIELSCVDSPFRLHSNARDAICMTFSSTSRQIQGSQFVLDAQQHFPKRPWKEVTERRLHLCSKVLWDFTNGQIQKKLKGVLRNQTSSETSLEFFPKCYFSLLTCKVINHLSDKGEVMWCQYDQVLVASEIFDFHIQSLHIWGLKNVFPFKYCKLWAFMWNFQGGEGYALQKNKRKPTTEVNRLTIYIQYIHSRIPMAQDAYLKETELAKEARPQEFCWPRSPSILT